MSGVSVDEGRNKRGTNAEIQMVPMIDLLTCCIAFLLITAVWVQTGRVRAEQPRSDAARGEPDGPPPSPRLKIVIEPHGLRVGVSAADAVDIPDGASRWDALREQLARRHQADLGDREVWIQPDDTVRYQDITRAMDVVYEVYGPAGGVRGDADRPVIRLL